MPVPARELLALLLVPRCATCRQEVGQQDATVNYGDLQFHAACQPCCATCAAPLQSGEGGWRSEGVVVSEAWGYSVRPTRFWCPDCLGSAPRSEPRSLE